MQILLGLALIIGMSWGAIKLVLSFPYGIVILIVLVIIWRACLK